MEQPNDEVSDNSPEPEDDHSDTSVDSILTESSDESEPEELSSPEFSDDLAFKKLEFFNIKCNIPHTQLRTCLRSYDEDNLHFISSEKVSLLNLKNGEITENVIPECPEKNGESLELFHYTKNFFFWNFEDNNFLQSYHRESKKVFKFEFHHAYEINAIDVTKDEKVVFMVGQTRIVSACTLDPLKGFTYVPSSSRKMGSFGNDVKISPDQKYLATATDSRSFQVFELDLSCLSPKTVFGELETKGPGGACDMIAWSCDSVRLASAEGNIVRIFNVKTLVVERKLKTEDCSYIRWSPVRPDVLIYSHSHGRGNAILMKMLDTSTQEEEEKEKEKEEGREKELDYSWMKAIDLTPQVKKKASLLPSSVEEEGEEEGEEEHENHSSVLEEGEKKKKKRNLTKSVESMEFSKDGKRVFIAYRDRGYHAFHSYSGLSKRLLAVGWLKISEFGKDDKWEKMNLEDLEERVLFLRGEGERYLDTGMEVKVEGKAIGWGSVVTKILFLL